MTEKNYDAEIQDLIIQPNGLEGRSASLYQQLLAHGMREVAAAPGTSTFLYMQIERYVYMYTVMKAMEEAGLNIMDMTRYNQIFTLFTKLSNNVLSEVKKVFSDSTNLQYLFVSRIMEALAGAITEAMEPDDAEIMLGKIRDSLYTLVEQQ